MQQFRSSFPLRRMLKAEDAEEYLGLNPGTLAHLRAKGEGPPFIQFGRQVRYDLGYLDAWAFEQGHEPPPVTQLGLDRIAFTDGPAPSGAGWTLVRRRLGRACWRQIIDQTPP